MQPLEQLEEAQAELEVAYQRIAELQQALDASGTAELRRRTQLAEDHAWELENRAHTLEAETQRQRQLIETLEDRLNDTERVLREEVRQREEAVAQAGRLRAHAERLSEELQRERARAAEAAVVGAKVAKDRQFGNLELEKAVTENLELRDEIQAMEDDLQAYKDAVATLKADMEEAASHSRELESSLLAANARIMELTDELRAATDASTAAAATVDARDAEMRAMRAEHESALAAAELETRRERHSAMELQERVLALSAEVRTLRDESAVQELEAALAKAQAEAAELVAQRDETAQLLDEQNLEVERLHVALEEAAAATARAVDDAVRAERRSFADTKKAAANAEVLLEDERGRWEEAMAQKSEVEAQLEAAEARLAEYERGYGLQDAVREQEALKEALRLRDADIARLTMASGMHLEAYDMLTEIAQRLAQACGHPAATDPWSLYPELELRSAVQSTVERLRSANAELVRQNDALEEQRTRLLRQLRVHAEHTGEKALKYYGLTGEQLMLVNEFAENLRDGRVELPVNDRTLELQEELRAANSSIRDLTEQLYNAKAQAASQALIASQAASLQAQQAAIQAQIEEAARRQAALLANAAAVAAAPALAPAAVAEGGETHISVFVGGTAPPVAEAAGSATRRASLAATSAAPEAAGVAAAPAGAVAASAGAAAGIPAGVPVASAGAAAGIPAGVPVASAGAAAGIPAGVPVASAGAAAASNAAMVAAASESAAAAAAAKAAATTTEALRGVLKDMVEENKRLREKLVDLEASQERRFIELRAEREREVEAMRVAESTRIAAIKAAVAAYAAPASLNFDSDATLAEVGTILRDRLDSGGAMKPQELAAVYRAFARLIQAGEAAAAGQAREHERATAATAQVEALSVQVARLQQANDRLNGELASYARAAAGKGAWEGSGEGAGNQSGAASNAGAPRAATPTSAAGEALLRKLLARLQPGAEGTPDSVDALAAEAAGSYAALVEALEELLRARTEGKAAETALAAYNDHLASLGARQTALYRSYLAEKARWEAEAAALRGEAGDTAAKLEALQTKSARLDAALEALGGPNANNNNEQVTTLKDLVRRLTRDVTALEVTQPILVRKCNLLTSQVAGARAAARTAELAALEADTHARQRILYLELWKRGAEQRLERLSSVAATWVPGPEHERVVAALQDLQQRHADLMLTESDLRRRYDEVHALPNEVAALRRRLEAVAAEAAQAAAERNVAKQEAERLSGSLRALAAEASGASSDGAALAALAGQPIGTVTSLLPQHASRTELITVVSLQRQQLAALEVSTAGMEKRTGLLAAQCRELEVALEAASSRAREAEEGLALARAAAAAAQTETVRLQGLLVGALPGPQAEELRAQLRALQEQAEAQALELTKARETADIASDQASAVTGLIKDREAEVEALSDQLLQLRSRTDDDAIIGRLQQEVLSLKTSFHAFLRKHDVMRLALQRTRTAAAALELAIDHRAGELLAAREEARAAALASQRVARDLATQLSCVTRTGLTLSQAEAYHNKVTRLAAALKRHKEDAAAARTAAGNAAAVAEASDAEAASFRAQAEDLKALTSGATTEVARRLADLHEQVKASQLQTLRQKRQITVLREEVAALTASLDSSRASQRSLEEQLVAAEADGRRKTEAIASLSAQLERERAAGDKEGDGEAYDSDEDGGDDSHPGPRGGESSSNKGSAGTRDDKGQRLRAELTAAKKTALQLRRLGAAALARARARRRRVVFLERQLAINGIDVAALLGGSSPDGTTGPAAAFGLDEGFATEDADLEASELAAQSRDAGATTTEGGEDPALSSLVLSTPAMPPVAAHAAAIARLKEEYEAETRRLQQAAQHTVAGLRDMLSKKNVTLSEYQEKIDALRRELAAERAVFAAEKDRVAQAAYADSQATIDKLKTALQELQAAAPAATAAASINQQMVERMAELEGAVEARDRAAKEAAAGAEALRKALGNAQGEAAEATSRAEEAEAEVAALRLARSTLESQLAVATREAETAAATFKAQTAARDKKLKALQASLVALKEEFVRAEEAHAVALVNAQMAAAAAAKTAASAGAGRPGSAAAKRRASLPGSGGEDNAAGAAEEGEGGMPPAALQAKVASLLTVVQRMRSEVAALKAREADTEAERSILLKELDALRSELEAAKRFREAAETAERRMRAELSAAEREVEATRRSLAAATEAAASAGAGASGSGAEGSSASASEVAALQRRVRVLEAQNSAFKLAAAEAAAAAAAAPAPAVAGSGAPTPAAPPAAPAAPASARSTSRGAAAAASAPAAPAEPDASNSPLSVVNAQLTERVRVLSENERKLRKKTETLQGRVNDLQKELDAARANEVATTDALTRVKAERDALEKRANALQKKQTNLDAATAAALSELEPVSILRGKMFAMEEEMAVLRKRLDIDAPRELASAKAEAVEARLRAEAAEADADAAIARLTAPQEGEGSAALRDAEDRFVVERALREKLADARRHAAGLEATLLEREAAVVSLQLEAEAAGQTAARLRKRLAEVTAFATIAARGRDIEAAASNSGPAAGSGKGKGKEGSATAGASRPSSAPEGTATGRGAATTSAASASSARREAELEDLVTALRRVADKQKTEIERLKRQVAAAAAATPAAEAASGLPPLPSDSAAAAALTSALGLPTTESAESSRALRTARAEAQRLRERVAVLEERGRELEAVRGKYTAAEAEIKALKTKYTALERTASGSSADAALAQKRAEALSARVAALEEEAVSLRAAAAAAAAAGGTSDPATRAALAAIPATPGSAPTPQDPETAAAVAAATASLRGVVERLEKENGELRSELLAFDADFFEEIEDLKYRYSEAAKKCRLFDAYVQMYPPTQGLPEGFTSAAVKL